MKTNLTETCLFLNVTIKSLGTRRKVKTKKWEKALTGPDVESVLEEGVVLTDAADPKLVGASKKILSSPVLSAISTLDGAAREYVRANSLQSMLRRGLYMVPVASVEEFDATLSEFATNRKALVAEFVDTYSATIKEAEASLGHLFAERDYRTPENAMRCFDFYWEWVALETPGKLKAISKALFAREQEKAKERVQGAAEEIVAAMRSGFQLVVSSLVNRLVDVSNGKKKNVLSEESVTKVTDFIATFKKLNVTEDADLEALTAQAEGILAGVEAVDLKDCDELRDAVLGELTKLGPALDKLVTERPRRNIVLRADEAA